MTIHPYDVEYSSFSSKHCLSR